MPKVGLNEVVPVTFHYMWPEWKSNRIFALSNSGWDLILIFHKPHGTNTKICRICICYSLNVLAKSLLLSYAYQEFVPANTKSNQGRRICHSIGKPVL